MFSVVWVSRAFDLFAQDSILQTRIMPRSSYTGVIDFVRAICRVTVPATIASTERLTWKFVAMVTRMTVSTTDTVTVMLSHVLVRAIPRVAIVAAEASFEFSVTRLQLRLDVF